MSTERLPQFAWCEDCWDQAAEGTRRDRSDELPPECEGCGSEGVFWI